LNLQIQIFAKIQFFMKNNTNWSQMLWKSPEKQSKKWGLN